MHRKYDITLMANVTLQTGLFDSIANERLREEFLGDLQLEFQRAVVHHQVHVVVVDEFTSGLLFEDLDVGIVLMLCRLLLTSLLHGPYLSSWISGVQ